MPENLFRSDRIDINHITVEPSQRETGLTFNPKDELTSNELEWLDMEVKDERPLFPANYLYELRMAKILQLHDSLGHVLTGGLPEGFWQSFNEAHSDLSGFAQQPMRVSAGVSMKIVRPAWLDQPVFEKGNFANTYEWISAFRAEKVNTRVPQDTSDLRYLLNSVILFPHNPKTAALENYLEDSVRTTIRDWLDSNQGTRSGSLGVFAAFRLAYPKKWHTDLLPEDFWGRAREGLKKMHTSVYSDLRHSEIFHAATDLIIMGAREVQFTDNGLEVVSNSTGDGLTQSAFPEERKY